MLITCVVCRQVHMIDVPEDGYKKWQAGKALIQDAMPSVPAEEREMLISGIYPECWDKLYEK